MNESTPAASRTVALVDTRWGGHHPTYLREFTASLLRLGANVLLASRQPEAVLSALPEPERARAVGRVTPMTFVHRNQGLLDPRRDHDPLSTILRWRASGRIVRAAEARAGTRADLVFFPYLDSYLRFAPFPSLPRRTLGRPWSGLYFRNAHLAEAPDSLRARLRWLAKGDRLLRSPDCRAVCVLDERFNDRLAADTGHRVIAFPDMTDETRPDGLTELARQVGERAAGRKIIGLISMERRKGLLTLLRAALRARELGEPWFFVAVGPFLRETFSAGEIAFCEEVRRKVESGALDNLYFDMSGQRIPDGAPYNSLFTRFDLVWAAYEDFEGSSNALTKAAAFRIPLLATAGQCVGGRVESYQMGRTFAQADVGACLGAIRGVLAGEGADGKPLRPRFEDYHRLHDRAYLDEIFRGFLAG